MGKRSKSLEPQSRQSPSPGASSTPRSVTASTSQRTRRKLFATCFPESLLSAPCAMIAQCMISVFTMRSRRLPDHKFRRLNGFAEFGVGSALD